MNDLFEKKKKYKEMDADYVKIFDQMISKYTQQKKTKEEMTKYIMRKCFKFLKGQIQ